jgi:hypothetical protein
MRIVAAAAFYFLIVFGTGFALGPIRVFWLEPKLGETIAVLCETPFLLAAMAAAAYWLPGRVGLPANVKSLAAMGLGALVLQQVADFAAGGALRGITPAQQVAHFATPAGVIYLALLIVFAAMPVLVSLPNRRLAGASGK